jgi:hypothetical protein
MKKSIFTVGALALSFLTASVMAQVTETQPAQPAQPAQQSPAWDYKKNPTVAAITSKYESKYITTKKEYTDEDYYPVLGRYESANTDAPEVLISLDATNRGMVWIEGLPQGKIKAYLRKSPATYKIPAQKTEDGKEVAEGTLVYDKEANALNILIGKDFNAVDPSSVFIVEEQADTEASGKTKAKKTSKPKTWAYSGSKVIVVKETTTVEVDQQAGEQQQ